MTKSTELVDKSSVGGLGVGEMGEFGRPSEGVESFGC